MNKLLLVKKTYLFLAFVLALFTQTIYAQYLDYAIVRIMVPTKSKTVDSREFFIEVNDAYVGNVHAHQYASLKVKQGVYNINLYCNTTPTGVPISNCTYEVAKKHGYSISYNDIQMTTGNVYYIDAMVAKGLSGQPAFDKALAQKKIVAGNTFDLTKEQVEIAAAPTQRSEVTKQRSQSQQATRQVQSENKPLNNKKVQVDGICYRLKKDHAEVTYHKFQSGNNYKGMTSITIPSEIEYNGITYPVTKIDNSAFWYARTISSITIPNNVCEIGKYAFTYCEALTSISLPHSISWIDEGTFLFCSSLNSIMIPEGVTRIEQSAFYGCKSLATIRIPNTVGSIGPNAFGECLSLRAFNYPEWIDVSAIGISNQAILKPYGENGDQTALTNVSETPSSSQQTSAFRPNVQSTKRQSDVDKNIVQSTTKSPNTYVLIMANENYEFLGDVDYAANDGKIFKEYCVKTLGVPERQIFYYENATAGKMEDGISKLIYCLNNFSGAKAIVYYCGHGIPDEKTNAAYLIPIDGKGTNSRTCYSLKDLYKSLAETKAQSITYFMDACFTGSDKDGSMLVAARGVARAPEKEMLSGKTVVFSASSGDETAMTLNEEGHGLFTYYLLKKLQETNGDVTYGELADYINRNVKKDAFLINEKPQTPVVATSPAVVNSWKQMKLK